MSSSSSSGSDAVKSRRRPTEIGWDTDEDDSLSRYILRGRPHKRARHESNESDGGGRGRRDLTPQRDHRLAVNSDASETKMAWRKRAMATGNFKILITESGRLLDDSPEFTEAVWRAPAPPRYYKYPRGIRLEDDNGNRVRPTTRYSLQLDFPGSGERHHIVWLSPDNDINVDRMVKLYDMRSVQTYQVEGLSDGPKSPWFGLADPRKTKTADDSISFDANLFWSVAVLHKHFGTCGVESWDQEIMDLRAAFFRSAEAARKHQQVHLPPPRAAFPTPPPPARAMPVPPPGYLASHPPPGLTARVGPAPLPAAPQPLLPAHEMSSLANGDASECQVGRRYTGCVVEWSGECGFLSCTLVPGRVFLHASHIRDGLSDGAAALVGTSVNFELAEARSGKGFQAIRANAFT